MPRGTSVTVMTEYETPEDENELALRLLAIRSVEFSPFNPFLTHEEN